MRVIIIDWPVFTIHVVINKWNGIMLITESEHNSVCIMALFTQFKVQTVDEVQRWRQIDGQLCSIIRSTLRSYFMRYVSTREF